MNATAAAWLLIPAAPIGLWVCYTDLSVMRIRNVAVLALLAGFVVIGALTLPLDVYLWRYLNLAVVLAIGMAMNSVQLIGAGDAKYAAAAAPYVAAGDGGTLFVVFLLCLFGSYFVHRLFKATVGPRLAPGWVSWDSGKMFPMGVPFALTLIVYLAMAAWPLLAA